MLARALSGKAVPASSTLGSGRAQGRSPPTPVHGRDGRQPCAGDRPRPAGGPPRGCGPACPAHGGRTLWAATARWSQLLRGGVDAAELPGPGEGVLGPSPVDQEPAGLPAQVALSGRGRGCGSPGAWPILLAGARGAWLRWCARPWLRSSAANATSSMPSPSGSLRWVHSNEPSMVEPPRSEGFRSGHLPRTGGRTTNGDPGCHRRRRDRLGRNRQAEFRGLRGVLAVPSAPAGAKGCGIPRNRPSNWCHDTASQPPGGRRERR
jgi:hypothetical protein